MNTRDICIPISCDLDFHTHSLVFLSGVASSGSPVGKPETPGVVKLWESPRPSRGLTKIELAPVPRAPSPTPSGRSVSGLPARQTLPPEAARPDRAPYRPVLLCRDSFRVGEAALQALRQNLHGSGTFGGRPGKIRSERRPHAGLLAFWRRPAPITGWTGCRAIWAWRLPASHAMGTHGQSRPGLETGAGGFNHPGGSGPLDPQRRHPMRVQSLANPALREGRRHGG